MKNRCSFLSLPPLPSPTSGIGGTLYHRVPVAAAAPPSTLTRPEVAADQSTSPNRNTSPLWLIEIYSAYARVLMIWFSISKLGKDDTFFPIDRWPHGRVL